ncbi:hypothetical protein I316_04711 [Kwoniella heveanensis BCC8398]|uniref:Uncharacterized protein n=1 Tax=Kwoniella heveanensis BCC8398 TaxID=1296120 RepID=A0A1B9GRL8_9TREE|nr:hypothetical protein I316_04711 [Kwoniella heveanensis BCC8398]
MSSSTTSLASSTTRKPSTVSSFRTEVSLVLRPDNTPDMRISLLKTKPHRNDDGSSAGVGADVDEDDCTAYNCSEVPFLRAGDPQDPGGGVPLTQETAETAHESRLFGDSPWTVRFAQQCEEKTARFLESANTLSGMYKNKKNRGKKKSANTRPCMRPSELRNARFAMQDAGSKLPMVYAQFFSEVSVIESAVVHDRVDQICDSAQNKVERDCPSELDTYVEEATMLQHWANWVDYRHTALTAEARHRVLKSANSLSRWAKEELGSSYNAKGDHVWSQEAIDTSAAQSKNFGEVAQGCKEVFAEPFTAKYGEDAAVPTSIDEWKQLWNDPYNQVGTVRMSLHCLHPDGDTRKSRLHRAFEFTTNGGKNWMPMSESDQIPDQDTVFDTPAVDATTMLGNGDDVPIAGILRDAFQLASEHMNKDAAQGRQRQRDALLGQSEFPLLRNQVEAKRDLQQLDLIESGDITAFQLTEAWTDAMQKERNAAQSYFDITRTMSAPRTEVDNKLFSAWESALGSCHECMLDIEKDRLERVRSMLLSGDGSVTARAPSDPSAGPSEDESAHHIEKQRKCNESLWHLAEDLETTYGTSDIPRSASEWTDLFNGPCSGKISGGVPPGYHGVYSSLSRLDLSASEAT